MTVPSIATPDQYNEQVKSRFGFHVVEVINNEVICAATTTNPQLNKAPVLVHCRVNPGGVLNFTIKSSVQQEI